MSNKIKKITLRVLSLLVIIISLITFMNQYKMFSFIKEEMNKVGYETIYYTVEVNDAIKVKNKISSYNGIDVVYPYPSIVLMGQEKIDGVEVKINDVLFENNTVPTSTVAVIPYYFEDGYDKDMEKIFISLDLADYLEVSNHIGPNQVDIIDNTKITIKTNEIENYELTIDGIVNDYYCAPYHSSFVILVPYQKLQDIRSHYGSYAVYTSKDVSTENIIQQLEKMSDDIQVTQAKQILQESYDAIIKNNVIMMAGSIGIIALVIGINLWNSKKYNKKER